jgi:hypothetical protein
MGGGMMGEASRQHETPLATVNIRPEVTILSVLRHLNYRPWFALAEFVDNSLQSYISNRGGLSVNETSGPGLMVDIDITTDVPSRIVIRDNAAGILLADFPRAFRPAHMPPDTSGLSEFGMGMKSAACWFANHWSVRTKALGENVERSVHFNINSIINDRLEELDIAQRLVPRDAHYTEIVLVELCHPPKGRTIGKIREHLASIYRVFLRDKTLQLAFNGELLVYEDPAVLQAPYYRNLSDPSQIWKKNIDMDFGVGQRVTGFAALRETASTSHGGFALFRRNRLIEGSADDTYRPAKIFGTSNSFRSQRLFGELHLQGFEVSHTKDGFRWEEYEEEFLDLLKEELEREPLDLIDQAEGFRAKLHRKTVEERARKATDVVATVMERDLPVVLELDEKHPAEPAPIPLTLVLTERIISVKTRNSQWQLTVRTALDPAIGDWLKLGESKQVTEGGITLNQVDIHVSLTHPFVVRFIGASNENVELFIRMAAAVALAFRLGDAAGRRGYLHYLNELLREPFSNP